MAESEQKLLSASPTSFNSKTKLSGSTLQVVPKRGLKKMPGAVGVTENWTSKKEAAGIVTGPIAVHFRSFAASIAHATKPVTPVTLFTAGTPYTRSAFGKLSTRIDWPLANDAAAEPWLAT